GQALANLDAQAEHIAIDNPKAASDMVQRIFAVVDALADFPALGRPGRVAGTREIIVPATPYIVVYRDRGYEAQVLRVLHAAQRWP
ncbi:MAG: type II toxin-antitoxin system RelE/ParE family toxin, partial [Rhodospirillales bacterium]|nr:type II toxin-antitoxin system RelE/ParE family toxin [Rhodospirillales bacterium]